MTHNKLRETGSSRLIELFSLFENRIGGLPPGPSIILPGTATAKRAALRSSHSMVRGPQTTVALQQMETSWITHMRLNQPRWNIEKRSFAVSLKGIRRSSLLKYDMELGFSMFETPRAAVSRRASENARLV